MIRSGSVFWFGGRLYLQRGAHFFDLTRYLREDVLEAVEPSVQKDLVRVRPLQAQFLHFLSGVHLSASKNLSDALHKIHKWTIERVSCGVKG